MISLSKIFIPLGGSLVFSAVFWLIANQIELFKWHMLEFQQVTIRLLVNNLDEQKISFKMLSGGYDVDTELDNNRKLSSLLLNNAMFDDNTRSLLFKDKMMYDPWGEPYRVEWDSPDKLFISTTHGGIGRYITLIPRQPTGGKNDENSSKK